MGKLDGQVAVITGAASGMGQAAAEMFVQEGAAVVVADIDEARGERVAADCRAAGGACVFHRTDVSREADIEAVVTRAVDEFDTLHVMVNNAGIGGPLGLDSTVEEWDYAHAVLLRGPWLGMKHAVPRIRESGGGAIISTASDNGIRSLAHTHAYTSMKAGLIKLTESVAQVVAGDRIRVNAIAPGWIQTPMLMDGLPGSAEAKERLLEGAQPLPQIGGAIDIARAMLFLASSDAAFITGVCLPVDGGWLSQGFQNPATEARLGGLAQTAGATADADFGRLWGHDQ
jgi:NAD(P)-dependent dehydrogenase (short-subunit alcohol dehydrogenase family)